MTQARFVVHAELQRFLPAPRRGGPVSMRCAESATVKQAIESLGVPHTEVDAIVVNGMPSGFAHRMRDGDRVEVHPAAPGGAPRLRPAAPEDCRFLSDAQLGGLARLLRMMGFDTTFDAAAPDAEIRRRATGETRILLSRDRALLMCRDVVLGAFVHALRPDDQLAEVADRFALADRARPFTRCLLCNAVLAPVDKAAVLDRLPPRVARSQQVFRRCPACDRVYWPGDHFRRMSERLAPRLPR